MLVARRVASATYYVLNEKLNEEDKTVKGADAGKQESKAGGNLDKIVKEAEEISKKIAKSTAEANSVNKILEGRNKILKAGLDLMDEKVKSVEINGVKYVKAEIGTDSKFVTFFTEDGKIVLIPFPEEIK